MSKAREYHYTNYNLCPIYEQLLDTPVTIPLRELILPHSSSKKAVLASKDLKSSKPHEQATMTREIERESPTQEYSNQPMIAIFQPLLHLFSSLYLFFSSLLLV
jgi:hypothetical protein